MGIVFLILLSVNVSSTSSIILSSKWSSDFRPYGGYIHEVRFVIFEETYLAYNALWDGEIDAYDRQVSSDIYFGHWGEPDVEVTFTPSISYRAITLNCELFPTNITAFRRAMAFGFDKHRANVECIGGIGLPQDGHIPIAASEWSVEDELNGQFYNPDYVSGNRSLENAGFIDLDNDGWREYDKNRNGMWDIDVDLDDDTYAAGGIVILVVPPDYDPHIRVCQIMQDGLTAMGVRSTIAEWDALCPIGCCLRDGLCWGLCLKERINMLFPPMLLYNNYRTSGNYNPDPYNYYYFSNSTIDLVLDQMVNSTSLEEAKRHAVEAAKLLAFEQPQIAIYSDSTANAYRTNMFDGFLEFRGLGTSTGNNPYFVTKLHLKPSIGGPYGGTLHYGLSGDLTTRNCFLEETTHDTTVFQYLYEKLWNIDPTTWDPIPGLAYDWEIESTTASGDILDGQRFTFHLYPNATWHDGHSVTSEDVKHSFILAQQSPRAPSELFDIYHIETPSDYSIEFFVNETGYFEWSAATSFPYIVPWHIWHDVTNVPTFDPTDIQLVGSGPYRWNEYIPGEYLSLLRHDGWRWNVPEISNQTSQTSVTSISSSIPRSTELPTTYVDDWLTGYEVLSLFITILGLIILKKRRNKLNY